MENHLSFKEIIEPLLDCRKKTYSQDWFIRDLFSAYFMQRTYMVDEAEDKTNFSRWRNGSRPVPAFIIEIYAKPGGAARMEQDFEKKILPNIINIPLARERTEELVKNSSPLIGNEKVQELLSPQDASAFFAGVVLYSILSDHKDMKRHSPDLSDYLVKLRIPKAVGQFIGREEDLKACSKMLETESHLFISGIAGIGKSEFVKKFAEKNAKRYTNILYIFYYGDLKRTITALPFAEDDSSDSAETLFTKHYDVLRRCDSDTLVILDNFDVYPEDDPFFHEFSENAFHLLVTTRCSLPHRNTLELKEMDPTDSLVPLFYSLCPSLKHMKTDEDDTIQVIRDIIDTVHCHTLTVTLAALTLSASGIEPEMLLSELQSCVLSPPSAEKVEISKDNEYSEGLMQEHLRRLIDICSLSEPEQYLMMNLSLLPLSGVSKVNFKAWLQLSSLSDAIRLVKYGFIQNDEENLRFSLHPIIRDLVMIETQPSISKCRQLFDSLHMASLVQGLEFEQPQEIIQSMISVTERIIDDDPPAYLLYLQDCFTFYDKYMVYDEMGKLVDRMDQVMKEYKLDSLRDTALLLSYKGQMCLIRKEYPASAHRIERAIRMVERISEDEMDVRTISLLSNLYNNLGLVWMSAGDQKEAQEPLEKAIQIRVKYKDLGLLESHDTIEQLINITTFHLRGNDPEGALQTLDLCESVIRKYAGDDTLDYGICRTIRGRACIALNDPVSATKYLKEAEGIIDKSIGSVNAYMKAVYYYLLTACALNRDHEYALEYQKKYKDLNRTLKLSDHSVNK